jgi:hypothetical protein
MFGNQHERLHCSLPFLGVVLSLRQVGDVQRRVAQRDQLASAGQLDWIEELLIPRQADYDRNSPK